jgi:hypothetical protein
MQRMHAVVRMHGPNHATPQVTGLSCSSMRRAHGGPPDCRVTCRPGAMTAVPPGTQASLLRRTLPAERRDSWFV